MSRLRALAGWLVRPDVLRDGHVYGGLLLAAVGGWQLSPVVTLVALGLALALLGLFAGRLAGTPAEEPGPAASGIRPPVDAGAIARQLQDRGL